MATSSSTATSHHVDCLIVILRPALGGRVSESRQVRRERRTLPLAQCDGDAQLLEVLLERLAAEVDLALLEEAMDVGLELGGDEPGDALGHPTQAVLGIETIHRVPLLLH